MNRRDFLRRGAVVGMAGALLGASVGKAQETEAAPDYGVPSCSGVSLDPLPELPAARVAPVDLTWTGGATIRPDYVWNGKTNGVTVDTGRTVELHVEINGRPYVMYAGTPYDREG